MHLLMENMLRCYIHQMVQLSPNIYHAINIITTAIMIQSQTHVMGGHLILPFDRETLKIVYVPDCTATILYLLISK